MSRQLWLVEAIERKEDDVMELIVERRDGPITKKIRELWASHSDIAKVDFDPAEPRLARLIVPVGARSGPGMDSLIQVLEGMIPDR